jgi:hypothetical protein
MALLVIVIGIVVAAGLGTWVLWATFGRFGETSGDVQTVASAAVARIAVHWDPAEIAAVTSDLPNSATPLAERYRILGDLVSVGKCTTYQLHIANGVGDAQVRCETEFAAAKTTVMLGLKQVLGQWKIYDIVVAL